MSRSSLPVGVKLAACLAVLVLPGVAAAQGDAPTPAVGSPNYIIMWGPAGFDTRSRERPCAKIACGNTATAVLRDDGRLFVQGQNVTRLLAVPTLPPGLTYTDVSINTNGGLALRSNGTVVGFGSLSPSIAATPSAPATPPGVRYVEIQYPDHGIARRDDGVVVAWGANSYGQTILPTLPPGAFVRGIRGAPARSALLLSNGSVALVGANDFGQSALPPRPPGVSVVDIAMVRNFTFVLRSDGQIDAVGTNGSGQLNVPALPPGLAYTHVAAGLHHGIACRSDNVLVAWGYPVGMVPSVPIGLRVEQLAAGQMHCVARLSDGSLLTWGENASYEHGLPYRNPLRAPSTRRYVHAAADAVGLLIDSNGDIEDIGYYNGTASFGALGPGQKFVRASVVSPHALALLNDGTIRGFGNNSLGQLNIPPLPAGQRYVDMIATYNHSVVLRSDGSAFAFGANGWGQCNLPAGVYDRIAAQDNYTLLLRSDGTLVYCGIIAGTGTIGTSLPAPVPSSRIVALAGCDNFAGAIRSDGTLQLFGGIGSSALPPQLPAGVSYVEIAGSMSHLTMRRSDGRVVVAGQPSYGTVVPSLDPGTSYVQVSRLAARVGPTSTYVGMSQGCGGSRSASRIIPRDTPRIGSVLTLIVRDLPIDIGLLTMSLQRLPQPLSLAAVGLPGCTWHLPIDGSALVSGQNHEADVALPIPAQPMLIGLRFYQQAVVLDPQAPSGAGFVVSEFCEGVVGDT
jgi:alpha-tubulin suppressor-like RCC1 family protein